MFVFVSRLRQLTVHHNTCFLFGKYGVAPWVTCLLQWSLGKRRNFGRSGYIKIDFLGMLTLLSNVVNICTQVINKFKCKRYNQKEVNKNVKKY